MAAHTLGVGKVVGSIPTTPIICSVYLQMVWGI